MERESHGALRTLFFCQFAKQSKVSKWRLRGIVHFASVDLRVSARVTLNMIGWLTEHECGETKEKVMFHVSVLPDSVVCKSDWGWHAAAPNKLHLKACCILEKPYTCPRRRGWPGKIEGSWCKQTGLELVCWRRSHLPAKDFILDVFSSLL